MTTQPQTYADIILARIAARRAVRRQQLAAPSAGILRSAPGNLLQAMQAARQAIGMPPQSPAPSVVAQPTLGKAPERIGDILERVLLRPIAPVLEPIMRTGPTPEVTIGGGLQNIGNLLTQGARQVGGKFLEPPYPITKGESLGERFRAGRLPSPYQGALENALLLGLPGPGQVSKGLKPSAAIKAAPLPASAKPLPLAIAEAAEKAAATVAQDKPGAISAFFDHIPGVKQARRLLRPGLDMDDQSLIAFNAEGSVKSEMTLRGAVQDEQVIQQIDAAFGPGASKGQKVVQFSGAPGLEAPWSGTILDIAQRPSLHALTPQQRQMLPVLQKTFDTELDATNRNFGTNIGHFPTAEPEGWFLGNVDASDAALEIFGGDLQRAARSGGAARRVFSTAYEHWKEKPDFVPVTDLRLLLLRIRETRTAAASRETFRRISGGKTRIEVVDELHPGLRTKKDAMAARTASLRNQVETAARLQGITRVGARETMGEAKAAQKRAQPLLEQVEALGEEYGPELSYLSGQVRELQRMAERLTKEGMADYERSIGAGMKRRDLTTELNSLAPQLDQLRRAYAAADTRPYALVQEDLFRYYPVQQGQTVRQLRQQGNNAVVRFLRDVTATRLSADASPLVGVQQPLLFLLEPGGTARAWMKQNPLLLLNKQRFTQLVANDLKNWQEYAFYMGRPMTVGSTPTEFAGGFIGKMGGMKATNPLTRALKAVGTKFAQFNDAMYLMLEIQGQFIWKEYVRDNLRTGISEAAAKAAAADSVSKILPFWQSRRLGLSGSRAALFQAGMTSVSFATKPAMLLADGARGIVKLGTGQALTHQERMGLRLGLTLAAFTNMLSVMSSALNAQRRGGDVEQAVKEALTPTSRHFMAITWGGVTIPIGGPYRGFIKAVVPREVEGSPVPIPFWGLGQWLKSRGQPTVVGAIDLFRNRDFYGNKIYGATFPWNVAMMLAYGAESVLPLSVSAIPTAIRTGLKPQEAAERFGGQILGVNVQENTAYQERDLIVQRWAREQGKTATGWADLAPSEQREFMAAFPQMAAEMREYQDRAAKNGVEWALRRKQFNEAEDDRIKMEEALAQEFMIREISPDEFRDQYSNVQLQIVSRKKQIDRDFQIFRQSGQRPTDPNKAALVDYYALYDEARLPSGRLDWEKFTESLERLQATWTPDLQRYVEKNTNLAGHPILIQEYLDGKRRWRNYWEAGDLVLQGIGQGELSGMYGQYKAADATTQKAIDRQTRGLFAQVQRAEDRARSMARRQNAALDAYLLRFGYVGAPAHRDNLRRRDLIQNLSVPLADIASIAA